jgi:hypothetical protein
VDITSYVDRKIDANLVNKTQGPAGENGARLKAGLAGRHQRLPLLGNDDRTANREYIRQFVLAPNREVGRKYGLEYAEAFHYIGPEPDAVEDYVRKNARPE